MSPHAPAVVHMIVQFQPCGHVADPSGFVIGHVWFWKLQRFPGHTLGQIAASAGASMPASRNVPGRQ